MPFKRWDPFQDLISLHQELFGEEGPRLAMMETARAAWSPAVDIYETDLSYVIKAEIPGVGADKVKIEYRDQRLIISGVRPSRKKDVVQRYHHMERSYGPFQRTFLLPHNVCCEDIEANYMNGIIEITLPKRPEPAVKNIEING